MGVSHYPARQRRVQRGTWRPSLGGSNSTVTHYITLASKVRQATAKLLAYVGFASGVTAGWQFYDSAAGAVGTPNSITLDDSTGGSDTFDRIKIVLQENANSGTPPNYLCWQVEGEEVA